MTNVTVVATAVQAAVSSGVSRTTLYTAPADGLYQFVVYMNCSTAGGGPFNQMSFIPYWTDNVLDHGGGGVAACGGSSTNGNVGFTFTVYAVASSDIDYELDVAGTGAAYGANIALLSFS